tara:strand:- start:338 stop:814 length:477 start_codon:yes stop_codon:yes gene_type:complete
MSKSPKSDIDLELVHTLAELLKETGLNEIEFGRDGLKIRVAKSSINTNETAEPIPPEISSTATEVAFSDLVQNAGASAPDHPGTIKSPMVGVIYTAPEPNSPPFIRLGDEVVEGQTLFLIEAMKVFNPITSKKTGKITRIFVDTETPVEFDEPLAIIE